MSKKRIIIALVIGALALTTLALVPMLGMTHFTGVGIAQPTFVGTATPALSVNNLGVSKAVEVLDSGTPVFEIDDAGVIDANANAILNIGAAGTDFSAAGGLTLAGPVTVGSNVEHVLLPTVLTATVPYTPATATVATIADGEIWLVHSVFVRTTTNFDCTGDDCTLTIGDGNDADGFIAAADAALQTTFTEATGFTAGWYGIESGSAGAYTTDDGGPFVYAPSGAAETIDAAVGGTSPAGGSATVYVVYTRVQ